MQRLTRTTRLIALSSASVALSQDPPKKQKLSIYPTETPAPQVVDSPTQLEKIIRRYRERATESYLIGRSHFQVVIDRWINVEHAVESRLKAIKPPTEVEPLTPGILWVGVSTLFGSIISRPRSVPIRVISPPLFFLVSSAIFLPHTTKNVQSYLYSLEEAYLPGLAKQQDQLVKASNESLEGASEWAKGAQAKLEEGLNKAVELVRSRTGLKVGEEKPTDKKQ